jgi:hypothetical protein
MCVQTFEYYSISRYIARSFLQYSCRKLADVPEAMAHGKGPLRQLRRTFDLFWWKHNTLRRLDLLKTSHGNITIRSRRSHNEALGWRNEGEGLSQLDAQSQMIKSGQPKFSLAHKRPIKMRALLPQFSSQRQVSKYS